MIVITAVCPECGHEPEDKVCEICGYEGEKNGWALQTLYLPNKARTRLETGVANADSESNPAVSSG